MDVATLVLHTTCSERFPMSYSRVEHDIPLVYLRANFLFRSCLRLVREIPFYFKSVDIRALCSLFFSTLFSLLLVRRLPLFSFFLFFMLVVVYDAIFMETSIICEQLASFTPPI